MSTSKSTPTLSTTSFRSALASIPAGEIPSSFVKAFLDYLFSTPTPPADINYADMFGALAEHKRSFGGKALLPFVKSAMEKHVANANMSQEMFTALWHGLFTKLVSVRTDGKGNVLVTFDTNGAGELVLDIPAMWMWVLQSGEGSTRPLSALDKANKPLKLQLEPRCIVVKETVWVCLSRKEGMTSIRAGDISVRQFLTLRADLKTEFRPNEMAVDLQGRPILEPVPDGSAPLIDPVTKDYVVKRADFWLSIAVLGFKTYVGLPNSIPYSAPATSTSSSSSKPKSTTRSSNTSD